MTRTAHASHLPPLVTRPLLAVLVLAFASSGCSRISWKKKKPAPDAGSALSPLATREAAPGVTAAPAPVAAPAPLDPLSPEDHAAVLQARSALSALDALVKKGVLTDSAQPEAGDAVMRCTSVEESRARLEALPDADLTVEKLIAESHRLCTLEVPILSANQTLKQVSISPSQASRRLMCGFASKDLAKARTVKPLDRRVHELDARFAQACK